MLRYLLVALLAMLLAAAAAADKITVDPNAPRAAEAESEQPADPKLVDNRLLQNVTMDTGSKRLHVVLDELSNKTGVLIRCGSNSKDWGVRDLPIVVCVKDLPLGKLIRAIADTMHLGLNATMANGVPVYRIYRDPSRRKALDDYFEARKQAQIRRSDWEWDAWTAAGKLTEADFDNIRKELGKDQYYLDQFGSMKAYAKVMAGLGPDVKKRLLAGESIIIPTSPVRGMAQVSPEMGGYVNTLLSEFKSRMRRQGNTWVDDPSTNPADSGRGYLALTLGNGSEPQLTSQLMWSRGSTQPAAYMPGNIMQKIKGVRPRPKEPVPPKSDYGSARRIYDQQIGSQLAKEKIKLTKPKDVDKVRFADAVRLVSQQSGYAFVCDDFASYKQESWNPGFTAFGDNQQMNNVLSNLQNVGRLELYADPDSKLIIGSSYSWWDRHIRLVAESYVQWLKSTLDGPGLDLDGALTIFRLTEGQREDWMQNVPGLEPLRNLTWSRPGPLWTFYDSLTPEDKRQARSSDGLPLAKFDPQYLAQVFQQYADTMRTQGLSFWAIENPEQASRAMKPPTDPQEIRKLVLCVDGREQRTLRTYTAEGNYNVKYGEGIPRTMYTIRLRDRDRTMDIGGLSYEFPIYGMKREIEVYKAFKEKEDAAKPAPPNVQPPPNGPSPKRHD